MEKEIIRIGITGPESTGKSCLARNLAGHYGTCWVPEYSREYLNNLGRSYTESDIVRIARGQLKTENQVASRATGFLFCDTEFLVLKVWSEFKYGRCHPWIGKMFKVHRYPLYMLCNIDLPWENDPLREHPDQRGKLFDLYEKALREAGCTFVVISGSGVDRLNNAVREIENFFFVH